MSSSAELVTQDSLLGKFSGGGNSGKLLRQLLEVVTRNNLIGQLCGGGNSGQFIHLDNQRRL